MKKAKRILSLVFSLIFMSFSVLPSFAASSTPFVTLESPYEYLLSCGYSEEFLNAASNELILKIYNAIGDNEIAVVEEKVIYLNESGNAYAPSPLGTINTNSLKITVDIAEFFKKDTNEIVSCVYSAIWEWSKNMPQIRHNDAITIDWASSIFGYSAFYAQDTVRNSLSEEPTVLREYDACAESAQSAIGHFNNIAFTYDYNYVGGGLLLLLEPTQKMFRASTDIQNTFIYFNFVHNRNPLGLGLSLTPEGIGITINAGLMSDSISKPYKYEFSR